MESFRDLFAQVLNDTNALLADNTTGVGTTSISLLKSHLLRCLAQFCHGSLLVVLCPWFVSQRCFFSTSFSTSSSSRFLNSRVAKLRPTSFRSRFVRFASYLMSTLWFLLVSIARHHLKMLNILVQCPASCCHLRRRQRWPPPRHLRTRAVRPWMIASARNATPDQACFYALPSVRVFTVLILRATTRIPGFAAVAIVAVPCSRIVLRGWEWREVSRVSGAWFPSADFVLVVKSKSNSSRLPVRAMEQDRVRFLDVCSAD